jgi:hypothetical protein
MFKKGDRVFCKAYGMGVITADQDDRYDGYPLVVYFEKNDYSCCYGQDCKKNRIFINPDEDIELWNPLKELL